MSAKNDDTRQGGHSNNKTGQWSLVTAVALGACFSASESAAQSTIAQPSSNLQLADRTFALEGGVSAITNSAAGLRGAETRNLRSRGFLADTEGSFFIDPDGDGFGVQVTITVIRTGQTEQAGDAVFSVTQTETQVFRGPVPPSGPVNGSNIVDGSVTGVDIQNGSVTGADITDGSVTGADVQDGSLTGADVQDGSLTGADIQDGSITQADLSNDSVGSAQIIDGSVTGADIAAETITGANVQDGSLTGADIQDGSITQADLSNDSVGSAQIIDGSVTQADLADNSVGSDQIIDGTVTGADIAAETITGANVQDDSLTGADIQDGSITQADLGNNSVGSVQIIDNSVASADIQDGGVANVDLADGAVDSRIIENDSILLEDLSGEVRNHISEGNANTLKQAKEFTEQRFNQLDAKVDRNAAIANDGVAMALAAQVPSLADGTSEAFSMGFGYYSGSTALAMAGTARVENSNWQIYGTLGYGFRSEKLGVSAGFLWSR